MLVICNTVDTRTTNFCRANGRMVMHLEEHICSLKFGVTTYTLTKFPFINLRLIDLHPRQEMILNL